MLDGPGQAVPAVRCPSTATKLGVSGEPLPPSCCDASRFSHLPALVEGSGTLGYRLVGYIAGAGSSAASPLSFCKLTKPHTTEVSSSITPRASECSGLYVPMSLWTISPTWKPSGNFWEQHCQAGSAGDLHGSAVNVKEIHSYHCSKY